MEGKSGRSQSQTREMVVKSMRQAGISEEVSAEERGRDDDRTLELMGDHRTMDELAVN